jgi:hypothetical protein
VFLAGTFGLSEGASLYPDEELKNEFWSPFRRVTDVTVDPVAVEFALSKVAETFFTKLDVSPSGAGLALTVAIDPTLVSFDQLRTSVMLQLESIGVPSASLSSTLDQIQRHGERIGSRGGNINRRELTFFVEETGFTIDRAGRIATESEKSAEARAERAEAERRKTKAELESDEKRLRMMELRERSTQDERTARAEAQVEVVRAKAKEAQAKIEEAKAEISSRDQEIASLRRERERLEMAAKDAELRALAAKAELEALRSGAAPDNAVRTVETRASVRKSIDGAQEALVQTAPLRDGLTPSDVEAEMVRQEAALFAPEIPRVPREVAKKSPRERAEDVVPVGTSTRARKVQDDQGRWRNAKSGTFTSAPKRAKASEPTKITRLKTAKPTTRARKVQDAHGRWRNAKSGTFTSAPKRSAKSKSGAKAKKRAKARKSEKGKNRR